MLSTVDPSTLTPTLATLIAATLVAVGALIGVLVRGGFDTRLLKRQLAEHRELTTEQLKHQQDLADSQLDLQREGLIVEAELQRERDAHQRAEARAHELLSERRSVYSLILNHSEEGIGIHRRIVSELKELANKYPDIDWAETPRKIPAEPHSAWISDPLTGKGSFATVDTRKHPAWYHREAAEYQGNTIYNLVVSELGIPIAILELIAPSHVVVCAQNLKVSTWIYDLDWDSMSPTELLEKAKKRVAQLSEHREEFLQNARSDLGAEVTIGAGNIAFP